MRGIRRDSSGISHWVLIILVLVIVVGLVILFIVPSLTVAKPLQTTIIATLEDGSQKTIYQDSAWIPATIIQVGGVTITALAWHTTFTATSQGYSQYRVLGLPTAEACTGISNCDSYSYFLFTGGSTSISATCSAYLANAAKFFPVPATFTNTLSVGTAYDLGKLAFLNADGTVIKFTASSMINIITGGATFGCPDIGQYNLLYVVQITIQALGQGTLPSATYKQTVTTPVTFALGSMSITGSTTAVTSWVPVSA